MERLAPFLHALFMHKEKLDAMDISPISVARPLGKAEGKKRCLEEEYTTGEKPKSSARVVISKSAMAGKGKEIVDLDFLSKPKEVARSEARRSSLVQIVPPVGPTTVSDKYEKPFSSRLSFSTPSPVMSMGGIFSSQDAIRSLGDVGAFIKNQEAMMLTLEAQKNAMQ